MIGSITKSLPLAILLLERVVCQAMVVIQMKGSKMVPMCTISAVVVSICCVVLVPIHVRDLPVWLPSGLGNLKMAMLVRLKLGLRHVNRHWRRRRRLTSCSFHLCLLHLDVVEIVLHP